MFLYERSPRSGGSARSPWAIKKTSKGLRDPLIVQRMDQEADILKKLNHPNIIGYRGYKRDSDGGRILAVENGQKALFDMIEELRSGKKKHGHNFIFY